MRLVLDEGKTIAVARDLDLTPSALAGWGKGARTDRDGGTSGLTTEERDHPCAIACPAYQMRVWDRQDVRPA